jgi:oligopeptide/dipeptide ABC transporter ATP-binding protein
MISSRTDSFSISRLAQLSKDLCEVVQGGGEVGAVAVGAAPRLTTERKTVKPTLTGDIPNAIERPQGCHSHPGRPFAMPVCKEQEPQLRQLSPTRSVACHPARSGRGHRGRVT